MHTESAAAADQLASVYSARVFEAEVVHAHGRYTVTARNPAGEVLWVEEFDNLVTTQGRNALLDGLLGQGTAYARIAMSLITAGTPAAGNTYATPGVTEATSSQIAARLVPTFAAASNAAKVANGVTFTCIASGGATFTGAMLVMGPTGVSTVGDTAASGAILYSAGTFGASRTLQQNDTLTVTYTGGA